MHYISLKLAQRHTNTLLYSAHTWPILTSLFSFNLYIAVYRKKKVLIRRYNNHNDVLLGKADTRIYPRDVIFIKATESPKGGGCYPGLTYAKPPIPLPVVYQDDYFAIGACAHSVCLFFSLLMCARQTFMLLGQFVIVNKPAGMVCHSVSKGGYDNNSVLRYVTPSCLYTHTHTLSQTLVLLFWWVGSGCSVLPHVLSPPSFSSTTTTTTSKQDENHNNMQRTTTATTATTKTVLEFPSLVHRLDAPTSGLLVVAKTLEAARDLSRQFAERRVCKTYTALLVQPTSQQKGMGKSGTIHAPVEGKPAVTRWKHVRTIPSTKGHLLQLVQFFPQTGRKHQLRQHAVSFCLFVVVCLVGLSVVVNVAAICPTSHVLIVVSCMFSRQMCWVVLLWVIHCMGLTWRTMIPWMAKAKKEVDPNNPLCSVPLLSNWYTPTTTTTTKRRLFEPRLDCPNGFNLFWIGKPNGTKSTKLGWNKKVCHAFWRFNGFLSSSSSSRPNLAAMVAAATAAGRH